ncbi:AbaSI family restriction endonuclease [Salinimicrobium soli]|uniref:AbaSI family restriction endonuclease n=1 Tax=Salinimicrobium soli TaxID=1254399 RepID=UPI003AAE9D63
MPKSRFYLTKKEYIKKQIARTNKKDYENYVISRIIHRLDNLDVKFVTQQYIKKEDGYYLADLYFPQLNYFIEIDEGHHLNQQEADKVRDADFHNVVGVSPKRIDVCNTTIKEINDQCDQTVTEIETRLIKRKRSGEFDPWDPEKEFSPDTWIKKGKITTGDKVAFRRIVDGCKAMGLNYEGFQRAGAKHPFEENTMIWFPKLYPNGAWENFYDEEKGVIRERNIESDEKRMKHVKYHLNDHLKRRIVFARVKDPLGFILYRFRGIFELDEDSSNYKDGLVWCRTNDEAKTYDYKKTKLQFVD